MHAILTANRVSGRGKVKTKAELRALCERHWLLQPPPAVELPPDVLGIVLAKVMAAEIGALTPRARAEARKVCATLGRLRCASRELRGAFHDAAPCWEAVVRATATEGRLAPADDALRAGKVSPRQVAVALTLDSCECGCGCVTHKVQWPFAVRCRDGCLRRRVLVGEHALSEGGVPVDPALRRAVPYKRFGGELCFARAHVLAHMRARFGLPPAAGLRDVVAARRKQAFEQVLAAATEEQRRAPPPALASAEDLERASISFYVFINLPHWRQDGYRYYEPGQALEEALAAAAHAPSGATAMAAAALR